MEDYGDVSGSFQQPLYEGKAKQGVENEVINSFANIWNEREIISNF